MNETFYRLVVRTALLCLCLLLVGITLPANAQTKAMADTLYKNEKYGEAAKQYELLLKRQGPSAVLYYNMGNAYYKDEQIPRAILAYERALLLNPADRDARFNLELARLKTADKQTPPSEMFFVTWWRQFSCLLSPSGWAVVAFASFVLLLMGVLLYAFSSALRVRKCGIYGAMLLCVVTVVANLSLLTQWHALNHRDSAIVMTPAVVVKSSPSENSTDLFLIHEGTRLRILDSSMREWREVEVEDGKQGWVHKSDMEVI